MIPNWLAVITTTTAAAMAGYGLLCRWKLGGVSQLRPLLLDLSVEMLQGRFFMRDGGQRFDAELASAVEDVNDRRLREAAWESLKFARRAWAGASNHPQPISFGEGLDLQTDDHGKFVALADESGRLAFQAIGRAEKRTRVLSRRFLLHR